MSSANDSELQRYNCPYACRLDFSGDVFFRKMQLRHEYTELSIQFKLLTFNLIDWFVASDTLLF